VRRSERPYEVEGRLSRWHEIGVGELRNSRGKLKIFVERRRGNEHSFGVLHLCRRRKMGNGENPNMGLMWETGRDRRTCLEKELEKSFLKGKGKLVKRP